MADLIAMIWAFFIAWNLGGAAGYILIAKNNETFNNCEGSDFLSPVWLYIHYKVNWFGAFMMCFGLNAMCPIWSIVYWFRKLCTMGRK